MDRPAEPRRRAATLPEIGQALFVTVDAANVAEDFLTNLLGPNGPDVRARNAQKRATMFRMWSGRERLASGMVGGDQLRRTRLAVAEFCEQRRRLRALWPAPGEPTTFLPDLHEPGAAPDRSTVSGDPGIVEGVGGSGDVLDPALVAIGDRLRTAVDANLVDADELLSERLGGRSAERAAAVNDVLRRVRATAAAAERCRLEITRLRRQPARPS